MEKLVELIQNSQSFLLKRILYYAKLHDYVKYSSTLEEAWVASVSGLSNSLIHCLQNDKKIPELNVDQDFVTEPITYFGRTEALKHRQRGISLEMFLGLIKYYRQCYIDLVIDSAIDQKKQLLYILWVNRFFDQNEIAFCKEWNVQSKETLLSELQITNRMLANEKNRYLTIFESIPIPVMLFDTEDYCNNINYAAQHFLQENLHSPGHVYYTADQKQKAESVIPCFYEEYQAFCKGHEHETTIEKDCESPMNGKKNIIIKFRRMLDVSGKFMGTVIILTDQTERKQIEEQLRYMSFHDMFTDLYNRAYLEQEITQLSSGNGDSIGIVSCDIDGLKIVNDNLGHHAGDSLIMLVGNILKSSFREIDMVCRIGGDEFLALMPFIDDDTIQKACQKIQEKIDQHNVRNKTEPISVSIGWAIGRLFSDKDIQKTIKVADNLMYSQKKTNHENYNILFLERFQEYGKDLFS